MRPRMLAAAALLALAAAPPAAHAAGPSDEKRCTDRPRTERDKRRCGGAGRGDRGTGARPWAARWAFDRVRLDGTTTVRYADTQKSYTVDGTVRYRAQRPGGVLDLRGRGVGGSGTHVGTARPVDVAMSSRSTYTEGDDTHDCSYAPPAAERPNGLTAIAYVKGARLHVQWSLTTAMTRCPVSMLPTMATMLPAKALSTRHPVSALRGRVARLPVRIDETIAEDGGTLRVTWTGTVTLRRTR